MQILTSDDAPMAYNDTNVLARFATNCLHQLMRELLWPMHSSQGGSTHRTLEKTNCSWHFLQILTLDTRFQIYQRLVPDPQVVQTVDILEPEEAGSKALAAFLTTNHEIRRDVLNWYSKKTSWPIQIHIHKLTLQII